MFSRLLAFSRLIVTMFSMWRWIYFLLIAAILAGPVLAMHNPACDNTSAAQTAVSSTADARTPCQESVELAEASKRSSHASPQPLISPPDFAPWTAVYSLSFLWLDSWVGGETAVNAPPNPPPRFL